MRKDRTDNGQHLVCHGKPWDESVSGVRGPPGSKGDEPDDGKPDITRFPPENIAGHDVNPSAVARNWGFRMIRFVWCLVHSLCNFDIPTPWILPGRRFLKPKLWIVLRWPVFKLPVFRRNMMPGYRNVRVNGHFGRGTIVSSNRGDQNRTKRTTLGGERSRFGITTRVIRIVVTKLDSKLDLWPLWVITMRLTCTKAEGIKLFMISCMVYA